MICNMYSVKSLGRHWNEARSIFLDWIKTLRFGMCKSFSGFMQRGKVLASLITSMDKKLVVATKWYFVNFAFSSYPSSGGYTWESRSVFACKAHSRKGLSVHRSTLEHFRLFLLWSLIPPSIDCGRLTWAAVGSELWALELMPKGCSSFFPQGPTSFCVSDLQRTLH